MWKNTLYKPKIQLIQGGEDSLDSETYFYSFSYIHVEMETVYLHASGCLYTCDVTMTLILQMLNEIITSSVQYRVLKLKIWYNDRSLKNRLLLLGLFLGR